MAVSLAFKPLINKRFAVTVRHEKQQPIKYLVG
jgi:hypothetical protein